MYPNLFHDFHVVHFCYFLKSMHVFCEHVCYIVTELSMLPILVSTVSIRIFIVRSLEMVYLSLIMVRLIGSSPSRRSCMDTLPEYSTLSALVYSNARVLMSSVSGMSLDTTFLASISLFFYASTDTRRLSADPSVSISSSHMSIQQTLMK